MLRTLIGRVGIDVVRQDFARIENAQQGLGQFQQIFETVETEED